jgi:hypothetical protein
MKSAKLCCLGFALHRWVAVSALCMATAPLVAQTTRPTTQRSLVQSLVIAQHEAGRQLIVESNLRPVFRAALVKACDDRLAAMNRGDERTDAEAEVSDRFVETIYKAAKEHGNRDDRKELLRLLDSPKAGFLDALGRLMALTPANLTDVEAKEIAKVVAQARTYARSMALPTDDEAARKQWSEAAEQCDRWSRDLKALGGSAGPDLAHVLQEFVNECRSKVNQPYRAPR